VENLRRPEDGEYILCNNSDEIFWDGDNLPLWEVHEELIGMTRPFVLSTIQVRYCIMRRDQLFLGVRGQKTWSLTDLLSQCLALPIFTLRFGGMGEDSD